MTLSDSEQEVLHCQATLVGLAGPHEGDLDYYAPGAILPAGKDAQQYGMPLLCARHGAEYAVRPDGWWVTGAKRQD